jgi:acyl carrier protein
MPGDPSPLSDPALEALVRQTIADVLVVPLERVLPDTRLSADLGAESIDYVDLVFRLEEALGKQVPQERWTAFLRQRLPTGEYATCITTSVVREFAEQVIST